MPNILYAIPFGVFKEKPFDFIAVYVTKPSHPAVDGKTRLGVFQNLSSSEIKPGALTADFGEVNVKTEGEKSLDIQQTLTPGLFWLVIIANTPITIRGISFEYGLSYSASFEYGVLPETFPTDMVKNEGDTPGLDFEGAES